MIRDTHFKLFIINYYILNCDKILLEWILSNVKIVKDCEYKKFLIYYVYVNELELILRKTTK